jgi:hypothetical protein
LDSVEIFGWGRELCSASLLGVRKGMMPRAGLCLGRGCFARGEGGVRDGPLASAVGRFAGAGRAAPE